MLATSSPLTEEICYDAPWEYTSAAAKILNGYQQQQTHDVSRQNETEQPQTTSDTSTANCSLETSIGKVVEKKVSPKQSLGGRDKSVPSASASGTRPPTNSNTPNITCGVAASKYQQHKRAAQRQQQTGNTSTQPRRHLTQPCLLGNISDNKSNASTFHGPNNDTRPAGDYDPPWEFKSRVRFNSANGTVEHWSDANSPNHKQYFLCSSGNVTDIDNENATNLYDRVPNEQQNQPVVVSESVAQKVHMFSNNNNTKGHQQRVQRSAKSQSICVTNMPVNSSGATPVLSRTQSRSPPQPNLSMQQQASPTSIDQSLKQRMASNSSMIKVETAFCSNSKLTDRNSSQDKLTNLLNSEAELRNRLIQHLTAGVPAPEVEDFLLQTASSTQHRSAAFGGGAESGTAMRGSKKARNLSCDPPNNNRRRAPQPAIRWSKIKQTPNAANEQVEEQQQRRCYSVEDRDGQPTMCPTTSNKSPIQVPTLHNISPNAAMSQSCYYDKVPSEHSPSGHQQQPNVPPQQQSPPMAQVDALQYDVPWEFCSKRKLERLLAEGQTCDNSAQPSTAGQSLFKTRSKTPPASAHQKPSTSQGAAVFERHLTHQGNLVTSKSMEGNNNKNISPSQMSSLRLSTAKSTMKSNKLSRNDLQLNIGGTPGLNPVAEEFDTSLMLERQGWYHGNITRTEAETRLAHCREGSYLVRLCESNKDEYALSLKSSKGFMHMKIQAHKDHGWVLGYYSQPFERIPQMVRYYSKNKLPIKGAEHMCLLQPLNEPLL